MIEDAASFIPRVGTAMTFYDMAHSTYEYLNPPPSFYQNSEMNKNEEAWFKWNPEGYPLFATSINHVVWGINDNVDNGYPQSMGLKIYATFHYVDHKRTATGWDYVDKEVTTPSVYLYMITPAEGYRTNHLGNIAMPLKPVLDVSSTYTGDEVHAEVKTIDWEVGDNIYNGSYGHNTLEYEISWGMANIPMDTKNQEIPYL